MGSKRGFTLIEVLIVVIILFILAAIVFSNSGEKKVETPLPPPAVEVPEWKEIKLPPYKSCIAQMCLVKAPDGHDYLLVTQGTTLQPPLHAEGCKACNSQRQ